MEYDFRAAIEAAANEAPQLREAPVMVPGLTLHVDGDYLAYAPPSGCACCTKCLMLF